MQNNGHLYLIPTPLAENSLDQAVVPFLKATIKQLDYFLVEDLRTARRYISSLNLEITIEELTFHELTKRTTREQAEKLLAPLKKGKNIGIMSEAGCPGIADPGALAVSVAHDWNVQVKPIIGPSSILLGLMASGFNGQQFCFHGYLPIKGPELEKKLKQLEDDSQKKNQTQIFIEAPYRNNKMLDQILKSCRPDTKVCVARDLNGKDEKIISKPVRAWKRGELDLHKIPSIFLLLSE
ncbi:MAG: SAM-dependent methyltransferase [Candidatus Cyclobacteriaceae bacterium M2_1C_046]